MSSARRAQRHARRVAEQALAQQLRGLVLAGPEEIAPLIQSFGDPAQDRRQLAKVEALLGELRIESVSRLQARCSPDGLIGDVRALVQTAQGPLTLISRWVCETGPYQPSAAGTWRVNANSLALRDASLAQLPLDRPTVALPVVRAAG